MRVYLSTYACVCLCVVGWQVMVYRLISRHTVEQRILQVAENKSCMNAKVMQDGGEGAELGGPKGMSMAEIVKMIEFGMK